MQKFRFGQAPMYFEGTLAPGAVKVLIALAQEPSVSAEWSETIQALLSKIEAMRLITCLGRFSMCYQAELHAQALLELCAYVESLRSSLGDLGTWEPVCEKLFDMGDGAVVLRGVSTPLHELVKQAFPAAAPAELGNGGTRFDFEQFFEKRSKVWQKDQDAGIELNEVKLTYPPIFSPRGVCAIAPLDDIQIKGPDVAVALERLKRAKVHLSNFVVNFGAADGECGALDDWNADPANCLAHDGFSAILVEGDSKFFPRLREKFGARDDISLMLDFMPLNNITSLLTERLQAMPTASSSPDLLKVDVDHADCLFMQEALRVIHPKLVHIEYMPQAPPPLDYVQHYQSGLLEVDIHGRAVPLLLQDQLRKQDPTLWSAEQLRQKNLGTAGGPAASIQSGREITGCSLTAFLRRAPGYALVAAGDEEALLVRRDLQPFLGVGSPPPALESWLRGSLCHPARGSSPDYTAWGFDFRSLADPLRNPEEHRQALQMLLQEHGASAFSLGISVVHP